MRDDMAKLLVTTPRIGSSLKNQEVKKDRRSKSYEDLPSKSSMRPKSARWTERKELNEYLNPLIRYLRKNCGKPWDKVYSNICANMDRRTVVQEHIFMHLFDFVVVKPSYIDGEPYRNTYGAMKLYKTGSTFYVDKNGILKEPKNKRPKYSQIKNPNIRYINDNTYVKNNKVWFQATLVALDFPWNYEKRKWLLNIFGERKLRGFKVILRTLSKSEKKSLKL